MLKLNQQKLGGLPPNSLNNHNFITILYSRYTVQWLNTTRQEFCVISSRSAESYRFSHSQSYFNETTIFFLIKQV